GVEVCGALAKDIQHAGEGVVVVGAEVGPVGEIFAAGDARFFGRDGEDRIGTAAFKLDVGIALLKHLDFRGVDFVHARLGRVGAFGDNFGPVLFIGVPLGVQRLQRT